MLASRLPEINEKNSLADILFHSNFIRVGAVLFAKVYISTMLFLMATFIKSTVLLSSSFCII